MKALILVDLQNEWNDPQSEYFVEGVPEVIGRINTLIDWARRNQFAIIFTQHEESASDTAFAPGSFNTQFFSELHTDESDIFIKKHKISPFYQTDLERHLVGVEEVVVAGILTNLCVRSLISDAYDRDFSIIVVKDCCVATNRETHVFTINDLKATRPEVQFVDLSDIT